MRPPKLNHMARHAIARAYLAGARPCEIAADWNVSQAYVLRQAEWHDRKLRERREQAAVRKAKETVRIDLPVREKRAAPQPPALGEAMALNIWSVRNATGISVPHITFQHGHYRAKEFAISQAA